MSSVQRVGHFLDQAIEVERRCQIGRFAFRINRRQIVDFRKVEPIAC